MEIEGHPTQDLIEELERRGGMQMDGTSQGPDPEVTHFVVERVGNARGYWLFLPYETFMTGMDDLPG